MADTSAPQFRRAVVALSGGRTDRSIVALASELARPAKAELVGVHVVEIDWTLPLDADVAGPVRGRAARARHRRGDRGVGPLPLETVLLQARDVGAAIVDEATERGADLIICGLPFRRRFGGDFAIGQHHPLRTEERPVRRLGRARGDARGAASMKAVVVGCGRVGAGIADELDRAGWQVLIIDVSLGGLRPPPGHVRRDRPPGRRDGRGRPAPRTAPRTPTCSSPSPRATTGTSWPRSWASRRSPPGRSSPRSTTRSARRRTPTSGIATMCRTNLMTGVDPRLRRPGRPGAPGRLRRPITRTMHDDAA